MSARASGLVALTITVLGLLMGPVNLIYCGFFSGSKVATHRLKLGRPLVLQLSPEMNTIEFKTNVAFNSNGPRQREEELQQLRELRRKSVNVKEYYYHAVLTAEGETIWERRFSVLRPAEVPHPISMTTFSVDRARIRSRFGVTRTRWFGVTRTCYHRQASLYFCTSAATSFSRTWPL